jgi:hypothetical protein
METEPQRKHMQEMTEVAIPGCPWRSLSAPIVREVLHALRFFESGNLSLALPHPSHRLIEGIGWWKQIHNRVHSKQMENDRKQRERDAKTANAQAQIGRR